MWRKIDTLYFLQTPQTISYWDNFWTSTWDLRNYSQKFLLSLNLNLNSAISWGTGSSQLQFCNGNRETTIPHNSRKDKGYLCQDQTDPHRIRPGQFIEQVPDKTEAASKHGLVWAIHHWGHPPRGTSATWGKCSISKSSELMTIMNQ